MCLGPFFVGLTQNNTKRNKIRSGGCDYELGDTKRIKQHRFHRGPVRGEGLFARILQFSMLAGSGKRIKKKKHSLSFSPNPTKRPARVRKYTKTGRQGATALHFWRLSLGDLWCLEKAMYARATSRPAGSEARGEGRERGNLPETTLKPPGPEGWWDCNLLHMGLIFSCVSGIGFTSFKSCQIPSV